MDDVHLIGDDIRTIEKNANVLLNACKGHWFSRKQRKTKYTEVVAYRGMLPNK